VPWYAASKSSEALEGADACAGAARAFVGTGNAGAGLEFGLFVESETPPQAVRAIIAKTTRIESEIVRFFIFSPYIKYLFRFKNWMNTTHILCKKDFFIFIRAISEPYEFLKSDHNLPDILRILTNQNLLPIWKVCHGDAESQSFNSQCLRDSVARLAVPGRAVANNWSPPPSTLEGETIQFFKSPLIKTLKSAKDVHDWLKYDIKDDQN
jgi:hypothetical protein